MTYTEWVEAHPETTREDAWNAALVELEKRAQRFSPDWTGRGMFPNGHGGWIKHSEILKGKTDE